MQQHTTEYLSKVKNIIVNSTEFISVKTGLYQRRNPWKHPWLWAQEFDRRCLHASDLWPLLNKSSLHHENNFPEIIITGEELIIEHVFLLLPHIHPRGESPHWSVDKTGMKRHTQTSQVCVLIWLISAGYRFKFRKISQPAHSVSKNKEHYLGMGSESPDKVGRRLSPFHFSFLFTFQLHCRFRRSSSEVRDVHWSHMDRGISSDTKTCTESHLGGLAPPREWDRST